MRVLCDMSDSEIIEKFLKGLVDPFSRASLPQRLNITTTEEEYLKQCELDFSQQTLTT
jgi:phage replication initiation protein